jgi:hypothetical protein
MLLLALLSTFACLPFTHVNRNPKSRALLAVAQSICLIASTLALILWLGKRLMTPVRTTQAGERCVLQLLVLGLAENRS